MKCDIIIPGDRSVGIADGGFMLDMYDYEFEDKEERENFRAGLNQFFTDFFDIKSFSIFSDECADCGSLLEIASPVANRCSNPYCISRQPY